MAVLTGGTWAGSGDLLPSLSLTTCICMRGFLLGAMRGRNPTLERLDRVLADWEEIFTDCYLQALSSSISDRCPVLLSTCSVIHAKRRFQFESFWLKLDGYLDTVREAWSCRSSFRDPLKRLDFLLKKTARALQSWGQIKVGNIKLQLSIAKEVVFRLDKAQDIQRLTVEELWLRRELKQTCLGLASLERTIARQRSRLI